jgi:hypothetical protein
LTASAWHCAEARGPEHRLSRSAFPRCPTDGPTRRCRRFGRETGRIKASRFPSTAPWRWRAQSALSLDESALIAPFQHWFGLKFAHRVSIQASPNATSRRPKAEASVNRTLPCGL